MASNAELRLLSMATGVTQEATNNEGEQKQLSPEELAFLHGALESACDAGASTKQMHSALSRLHQFVCTGAVAEEHDEDDVEETVDALGLLREEFDDMNKTAVLTHTQSGALEMLLWLWDQHHQSILLQGEDAPAGVEERRAHALEIVERRGWGSNVPQAIRKASISTIAAALHSNPPVQNLLARFGFMARVLDQLRTFDAATASTSQADFVLRLVAGLSSYTSNHAVHEQALIESGGLALLQPWVSSKHPRLATKVLFLFRNILRHNPHLATFPADFPSHLAGYLSLVGSSDSETLSEMAAAFLEEATAIAEIRERLLQAVADKEALRATLAAVLADLDNQDRHDEREHLNALHNNLFASN